MVAVLLQLYRMASSPKTFPDGKMLRNLPSLDTSTLPSEKQKKRLVNYLSATKMQQISVKNFQVISALRESDIKCLIIFAKCEYLAQTIFLDPTLPLKILMIH